CCRRRARQPKEAVENWWNSAHRPWTIALTNSKLQSVFGDRSSVFQACFEMYAERRASVVGPACGLSTKINSSPQQLAQARRPFDRLGDGLRNHLGGGVHRDRAPRPCDGRVQQLAREYWGQALRKQDSDRIELRSLALVDAHREHRVM